MGFCPDCRYEYQAEVLVCPDCNMALVSELPPSGSVAMVPDDSWIAVGGVSGDVNSELARGSLDSSNIPSVVLSSAFKARGWETRFRSRLTPTSHTGDLILVPREYREEAELVLRAALGDNLIPMEPQ